LGFVNSGKTVVHFEYFIDFYRNLKGNIDEISSSSFRIRGKNLKFLLKLIVIIKMHNGSGKKTFRFGIWIF